MLASFLKRDLRNLFRKDASPNFQAQNGLLSLRSRWRSVRSLGICTPVLGELWSGVEGSICRDRNLHRLRLALSRLVVWPYTNEAAEQFGRVFAELRRIGRPMQQIDIMVAAIAFALGNCTVVSKDTDLAAIPGLEVENWAER